MESKEIKYETEITNLGRVAREMNDGNMIILFNDDVDDFAIDFAFLHPKASVKSEIKPGDSIAFDSEVRKIIRVGENVENSLKEQGHVVLKLDDDEITPTEIILDGECETFV